MPCWSKQANTSLEDDMFDSFATQDPHGSAASAAVCNRIFPMGDPERLVEKVPLNISEIGGRKVIVQISLIPASSEPWSMYK